MALDTKRSSRPHPELAMGVLEAWRAGRDRGASVPERLKAARSAWSRRILAGRAHEFRPSTTDLPHLALLRVVLAPAVCGGTLLLSLALCGARLTQPYSVLLLLTVLLSAQIFGELPFGLTTLRRAMFVPHRLILTDWLIFVVVLSAVGFLTKSTHHYAREVLVLWVAMTPFALQAAQVAAREILRRSVPAHRLGRSKIIVGLGETGDALARRIAEDPCRGTVLGFFDDRTMPRQPLECSGRLLGSLSHVAEYVRRNGVQVVYITLPAGRDPRLTRLMHELQDTTASIYFVPDALPRNLVQPRLDNIGGIPVIAVCETPIYGINGILKTVFDYAVAAAALAVLWPLMAVIALLIRLESKGPVIFKQRRYGLDGNEILVYKFRTMRVCEDGEKVEQAHKGDTRVTRLGAFLRRTSLDELPQFFNVLEGTMSVVGPRPHAIAHNEQYRAIIDGYMVRHKVKPGITGWAQVNGCRGETETLEKMKARIDYDLDYLCNWSLALDLWIVLRTVRVVFKDSNAY